MKQSLRVVFGKEQVLKVYDGLPLSEEEQQLFVKEYEFVSLEEKLAFIRGLNEASGWSAFCIPELELCADES